MNAAIDFIKNHCLTNSNEINQLKLTNGKLRGNSRSESK